MSTTSTTGTATAARLGDGIDAELRHLLPESLCRTFRVMPYAVVDGTVLVASADADDEIALDTAAAENAFRESTVPANTIDMLIYAGVCREHFEPATACHVAAGLQRAGQVIPPSAHVYDVSNACLGVLNGMLDVASRIELGEIRAGMVVSCETARDIVDTTITRLTNNPVMEEFKTAIATLTGGSAAVAVILSDGSFGESDRRRLRGAVVENAPEHHMLCRWGLEAHPDGQTNGSEAALREFASTDAAAVLEHGIALGSRTWDKFLAEMEWSAENVDRTVCHQVGSAHRDVMLRTMGLSPEQDFVTYEFLGNTGTAALPVAAALAWRNAPRGARFGESGEKSST